MGSNHTQTLWAALGLTGLAFALNLPGLATDSFWGDEIFTATFANRSYAEIIRWTANDIHPPLYYLLAGTFTSLTAPLGAAETPTATSDWLWRFPSVAAVVLAVAVTYRLALAFGALHSPLSTLHRLTAISAPLLLALAPIAVKYGQEARMHALFLFLSALSTWFLFRALAKPRHKSRWLAYALATTATIYTMYFGFLIIAAHGGLLLALLIHSQFSRMQGIHYSPFTIHPSPLSIIKSWLIGFSSAITLTFLAYLPWWSVLFNILRQRAAVGAIEGGVGSPLTFMTGVVDALGPRPTPVAWGFLFLFILGLILLARRNWPLATFGALWLALPVALPIFLGDPRALQFRYAFILPLYLTIITYAVIDLGTIQFNLPIFKPSNLPISRKRRRFAFARSDTPNLPTYLIWLLATLSFIAVLGIYNQPKPDWRGAAAYLTEHTTPVDIVLIGPLWDEGRFISYYFRGQAQLLTPAALVTNIQGRSEDLRRYGGQVWAINRFAPVESPAAHNVLFAGLVISEPKIPVYEPALLTEAAIDLARQAVEAAYPWAAEAEAQGVLDPDPRTAQAVALRALGDSLVAAGRSQEAIDAYQTAVDIFPGWVNGYLALAETQEAVGNLPAAAQAYGQAVSFNLEWQGPLAEEANRLLAAHQWAAAIAKFHQIMDNE